MSAVRVSLSVVSEDPQTITRAVESMSRAMAGLVLEGVDAFMVADPNPAEDDE